MLTVLSGWGSIFLPSVFHSLVSFAALSLFFFFLNGSFIFMPSISFDAKHTGYPWTSSLLNFPRGLEEESREKPVTFLAARAKTPLFPAASEAERPLQTRPVCVPLCIALPLLFFWTRSSSGRLLRLFLFTLYFTLGANRDVSFEVQGETLSFIIGFLLTLSEICHQWAL